MSAARHEWTAATVWTELYDVVPHRGNSRRKRLFVCACLWRVWDLLIEPVSRRAVEASEQFADGLIGKDELKQAGKAASRVVRRTIPDGRPTSAHEWAASAAWTVCHLTPGAAYYTAAFRASLAVFATNVRTKKEEEQLHSPAFHDIFGNPFRPVVFDTRWRSESALALARTAYETRNFTLLPVLADALEDAGCDNADVLAHCRDPQQVHVRGCWVVDGVLGRS